MVETTKPLAAGPAQNSEAMPALWWLWLPLGGAFVLLACAQLYPAAYEAWVAGERGALEFLHVVIPLACLALALRMLTMPEVRRRWPLWLWLALAALGSLYVAGEEASWGQHYFGWATPETWQAVKRNTPCPGMDQGTLVTVDQIRVFRDDPSTRKEERER